MWVNLGYSFLKEEAFFTRILHRNRKILVKKAVVFFFKCLKKLKESGGLIKT